MRQEILREILVQAVQEYEPPTLEEMGIDEGLIEKVHEWAQSVATYGQAADYIPQLAEVDTSKRAIAIGDLHRNVIVAGNGAEEVPTIQSVIKPFLYVYALERGTAPGQISRLEATSLSFHSDRILDPSTGESRPGHPLNNAGGISSAGAIDDFGDFVDFMRAITGNATLDVVQEVFASEMETNHTNRAIAYRLAASGRFDSGARAEKALENYTMACSLGMGVRDTLRAGLCLAAGGRLDGETFCRRDHVVRTLNAMNSFGLYQYTGELTLLASGARALTCKSGVSGQMLSVDPGRGASCTYSPLLDGAGNSVFGKYALIPLNALLSAPKAMRLGIDHILETISEQVAREGLSQVDKVTPRHE